MEIWNSILDGARNSSELELVAAATGIFSVYLAKRENIWLYPIGLISVGLYVFICFQFKLYADMGINAYYFIVSIYGWIYWNRKVENAKPKIERLNKIGWITGSLSVVLIFLLLYFILSKYSDSDVVLVDSFTSALFIIAMVWMARKKLEHWYAWILGDLISIPLYLYKGLAFTSAQYLIFTFLAVWGLITWKRKYEIG